ncbi:protein obstructor-E-like [Bombyx mandarina]|uniref:Chitin-binding type-2 domain-containing protein n=2 Tax=Bombyx TaxID=7090 RepID=A0A8R2ARV8_BOMMO|nr:protein obstructor-E [Bombyx mori]XP_028035805.1 protein obstructor-E-like [Bombyx mandarina]
MLSYIYLALLVAASHVQSTPAAATAQNVICKARNGYYKTDANCDTYIECRDYQATNMICPDGLHFNPSVEWPAYPCGYPVEVTCVGRGSIQPAQTTPDCPHQYGIFKHPNASPTNCGQYRTCVGGRAFDMVCPPGLAFNPDFSRCDWADLVPSCDAEKFLGFTCPPAPLDAIGNPLNNVINYKYEGNCYYFFSCEQNRARLLSCDIGLAFDPTTGRCVDADRVQCNATQNTNDKNHI